ncbi:MAG: RNA methyltransferase [Bryobacteraceae bacterium]
MPKRTLSKPAVSKPALSKQSVLKKSVAKKSASKQSAPKQAATKRTSDSASVNASAGLKVVLVAPRNPLNIGAAARAMSNFGFAELRLVNPYSVAFQEARSAVKAHRVLEKACEYQTLAEAVADCNLVVGTTSSGPRALEHPLRRLEHGGKLIAKHLPTAPVALLFGSEKFGLSNEDMAHCHWLMRIPTREEHGSMNLGQAVALCLYEIIRNPTAARAAPDHKPPAAAGNLERITEMLEEVLKLSGYVQARTAGSAELKIRRLIRRMEWNAHDAEVWMGMLRQIRWKLGQNEELRGGRSRNDILGKK